MEEQLYTTELFDAPEEYDFNNETWSVIESFFDQPHILVRHHIEAFNDLMDNRLKRIIEERNPKIYKAEYNQELERHMKEFHVSFTDLYVARPVIKEPNGAIQPMYPQSARRRNMTYAAELFCDIRHKLVRYLPDGKSEVTEYPVIEKHPIGMIPIMLGSKYCVLSGISNRSLQEFGECIYDDGAYFIVRGADKVLMCQEKKCDNKDYCFGRNKITSMSKYGYISEIASIDQTASYNLNRKAQIMITVKDNQYGGKGIFFKLPLFAKDVPVMLIFKALGYCNDSDILEIIVHDINDPDNADIISYLRASLEADSLIRDQRVAVETLSRSVNTTVTELPQAEQQRLKKVYDMLQRDLFPHMGTNIQNKVYFLGYMINKLIKKALGRIPFDDRDSFINKRIENVSELIGQLYRTNFNKMLRDMEKKILKEINAGRIDDIYSHLKKDARAPNIESGIKYAFSTGNWGGKNMVVKHGVAQMLARKSYIQSVGDKRRIVAPFDASSKQVEPRKLNATTWGMLCPMDSPEGHNVGKMKNLALTAYITIDANPEPVRQAIMDLGTILFSEMELHDMSRMTKVMLNGTWLGVIDRPAYLVKELRKMRRKGVINIYTSVAWNMESNEIQVLTDAGRLCRPLYIVQNNRLLITLELFQKVANKEYQFIDLLTQGVQDENGEDMGVIEYIDTNETDCSMIAMTYEDLKQNSKTNETYYVYTHCELHPSLMMGAVVSQVPYPEHNDGVRNIYSAAQSKQSISIYATNFNERLDTTSHVLDYPQRPVVTTRAARFTKLERIPAGMTAIVAVAVYEGYNQEDSLILNQQAIQRGLFGAQIYHTYKDEEKRNQSNLEEEKFCRPQRYYPNGQPMTEEYKSANYDKLDENGFIRVGEQVMDNDILIGKVIPIRNAGQGAKFKDASTIAKPNETGYVDRVYVNTGAEGYQFCKVRVRSVCTPIIGDKFAARHGQKGTISMTFPQEDMPCTADGVVPDIIISPWAFPKRMTIGYFMECVASKIGLAKGVEIDGTPFMGYDKMELGEILQNVCGMHHSGTQILYNGMTGEQIRVNIFMGPIYYYRLKHLVSAKIHCRTTGPTQILTRQPTEGRARLGGLRIGEMERDALLSHGITGFLKEKMFDLSDKYFIITCRKCGSFAVANQTRNLFQCRYCPPNSNNSYAKINIPYSCKLFFQELQAMTMMPRLFV